MMIGPKMPDLEAFEVLAVFLEHPVRRFSISGYNPVIMSSLKTDYAFLCYACNSRNVTAHKQMQISI